MKNKIAFVVAFIVTMLFHSYILHTTTLLQTKVTMKPQKNISPIIKLQKVRIRQEPIIEPVIEPIVEKVLPKPPKPVLKKKVIKKIVKKPKVFKKKRVKKLKKIKKQKHVKKRKHIKSKRVSRKKTKKTKITKHRVKTQRPSASSKAIKDAYLAKVRRIIERHKKYPRISKRMRQQGSVYVKFIITRNGRIRHVHISKKCPYAKLNKAAMKILKKIGLFAPLPKELKEQHLSLTIPIRYKILN